MTICAMCNGMGRIDTLDSELCAFCNGTGKYTSSEDSKAIEILDDASAANVRAGDLARTADYIRMSKRRI